MVSPDTGEGKDMSYSLPDFLAHAIAMEDEAAERYLELADMMEAHNNLEVAKVFRQMNHYSTLHGNSIKERAASVELPKLNLADFRWVTPPEVTDEDAFDYELDPFHALQFARENEKRAAQYYQSVADEADDAEVKRLAAEFAEEEQEHTAALDKLIEATPRSR